MTISSVDITRAIIELIDTKMKISAEYKYFVTSPNAFLTSPNAPNPNAPKGFCHQINQESIDQINEAINSLNLLLKSI